MSSKKFHSKSTALEVIDGHDLTGYEVIVTGGASGIGIETVRALAMANARVVLAARDLIKAQQVVDSLNSNAQNKKLNIEVELLDLASLKNVKKFCDRFLAKERYLNILVNNAGIMACPLEYTEDGFELQFGTNHMGHFALFKGLIPALKLGAQKLKKPSRVVSVSSIAHVRSNIIFDDINYLSRPYDIYQAYGQSKTANVLFSVELTRRYQHEGIVSNALMPGRIPTNLQKYLSKEEQIKRGYIDENGNPINNPNRKTPEQGASTSVWAAVAQELENKGGLYLDDCQVGILKSNPDECYRNFNGYLEYAVDRDNAFKLWEICENWLENPSNIKKIN